MSQPVEAYILLLLIDKCEIFGSSKEVLEIRFEWRLPSWVDLYSSRAALCCLWSDNWLSQLETLTPQPGVKNCQLSKNWKGMYYLFTCFNAWKRSSLDMCKEPFKLIGFSNELLSSGTGDLESNNRNNAKWLCALGASVSRLQNVTNIVHGTIVQ